MNRILYLSIILSLTLTSCDKRSCGCLDENIDFTSEIEDISVSIPNAVNESCSDFVVGIYSKTEIDIEAYKLSLTTDGFDFLANQDLPDFIAENRLVTGLPIELSRHEYILKYPIDLFKINNEVIAEEMGVHLELASVTDKVTEVYYTTYFYRCEDIDSDFDSADCRWPSQIGNDWHSSGCDCR